MSQRTFRRRQRVEEEEEEQAPAIRRREQVPIARRREDIREQVPIARRRVEPLPRRRPIIDTNIIVRPEKDIYARKDQELTDEIDRDENMIFMSKILELAKKYDYPNLDVFEVVLDSIDIQRLYHFFREALDEIKSKNLNYSELELWLETVHSVHQDDMLTRKELTNLYQLFMLLVIESDYQTNLMAQHQELFSRKVQELILESENSIFDLWLIASNDNIFRDVSRDFIEEALRDFDNPNIEIGTEDVTLLPNMLILKSKFNFSLIVKVQKPYVEEGYPATELFNTLEQAERFQNMDRQQVRRLRNTKRAR